MNAKGVAAFIAAIVILSSLFFFIHVVPPTGPVKIPKNVIPPPNVNETFFYNETVIPVTLDTDNATLFNFTFSGNATTVITGYLKNASSGQLIQGSDAYISLYPAGAISRINSGRYSFTALRAGTGYFFIKVSGFAKKEVLLTLTGKTIWLNLSLIPAVKYSVSGSTVYQNGTAASNVQVIFSGIFSSGTISSNGQGLFSIDLYNDSYSITVFKKFINPQPYPYELNVSGSNIINEKLTLTSNHPVFNVSGYVLTATHSTISDANVHSFNDNRTAYTNINGFYTIQVPLGTDTINASKTGYGANQTILYIDTNKTDVNITLNSIDPFKTPSYQIPPPPVPVYNSTVNYSARGTYILEGKVNNTLDGLPVALTLLNFISVENGTYRDTPVETSINGTYVIEFIYPGNYSFLIETLPYFGYYLNVSIVKNVTLDNFSLSPKSSFIFTVTGEITNAYNHLYIPGASVKVDLYNLSNSSVLVKTNSTGFYDINLVEGNYTFNASAVDYLSNETKLLYIDKNLSMNISLTPIVNGLQTWTNELIPGLTEGEVVANLTGAGNYTSSSFHNVTFNMLNASTGKPIVSTYFLVIFRVSNHDFYVIKETNSSGSLYAGDLESGDYRFFIASTLYDSYSTSINNSASVNLPVSLIPRQLYITHITLFDSANTTSEGRSVPSQTLLITNSSLPINITYAFTNNGTVFSFPGYNATFNISYENVHFTSESFSISVSEANTNKTVSVTPYAVILDFDAVKSFYYAINSGNPKFVPAGSGNITIFGLPGKNLLAINLTSSKSGYFKNATLTATSPVINVFLNASNEHENLNTSLYTDSNGEIVYVFSNTSKVTGEIYGGNVSLNLSGITYLYINNSNVSFTGYFSGAYSDIYLDTDFQVNGTVSVRIITDNTSANVHIATHFEVYYYGVSLN
ncbi:MAG: carboxypeptidase-like regulatory domain-containing protein [Thermoplasmataceae archaeon]